MPPDLVPVRMDTALLQTQDLNTEKWTQVQMCASPDLEDWIRLMVHQFSLCLLLCFRNCFRFWGIKMFIPLSHSVTNILVTWRVLIILDLRAASWQWVPVTGLVPSFVKGTIVSSLSIFFQGCSGNLPAPGFQLTTFSTAFIFSLELFGFFKGHRFLFFLLGSLWMLLLP